MVNADGAESLMLGQNIRSARKKAKVSLQVLSSGTGLSTSFLSQLERGKVNVSVDNLRKVASFLGMEMVQFFEVDQGNRLGTVTRKGQGAALDVEGSFAHSESLIRKGSANVQATIYTNPPGEGRKEPAYHSGEEFVFVISGEVVYILNDQEYHLQTGDSMYYRSEVYHSWRNPGETDSVIIIFNTPTNW